VPISQSKSFWPSRAAGWLAAGWATVGAEEAIITSARASAAASLDIKDSSGRIFVRDQVVLAATVNGVSTKGGDSLAVDQVIVEFE
jgi:hypothetical protein